MPLATDIRFAFRRFARTPFTTVTMVVLVALGIGLNSVLFMVLYSFARMPAPGMPRDESLVRIRGIDRNAGAGGFRGREFAYPEYREYANQRDLFSAVVAWTSSDVVLRVGGQEHPDSGAATYVTAGYFPILGVRPVLGADLPASADEAAPDLVGVISHAVWDRYFGRASDVLNRTIHVNDVPIAIVGVAPPRFAGTRTGGSQMRVWLPLNARPVLQRSSVPLLSDVDTVIFSIGARLQPGVTADGASPIVEAIATRTAPKTARWQRRPAISTDVVTMLADNYYPPSGEEIDVASRISNLLLPLLVLLIPCTNVSGLLVGLGVARRREIAVRFALGASRRRVIGQLLTESMLLALAAGGLGLFLIWVFLTVFGATVTDMPLALEWPMLVFTFGVALLAGLLFGVSPALHATRVSLVDMLKDGGGAGGSARSRLQSVLVIGQVALTQPLLLALAALILEMAADFQRLPNPMAPERIVQVTFYAGRDAPSDREEVIRRLRQRIAELPGVVSVVPQSLGQRGVRVSVHPSDRVPGVEERGVFRASAHSAPPGYFDLMGFPIVRGRGFDGPDADDDRVIVIRGDLARRLWGSADPIGRRLVRADSGAEALVVIGVVDENVAGETREGDASIFVSQVRETGSVLVRTLGPGDQMIPIIRSVANIEAPAVPVTGATTLAAIESSQRSSFRWAMTAAVGGGLSALILSAIGLYAAVSFAVGRRVREIGIRTALGADSRGVIRLFFVRGLRLSLVGLLIGLALSLVVVRLVSVAEGNNPPAGIGYTALIVGVTVVVVAVVATWIPARRAAAFDPITALRTE